ncbi:zinc finger protein 37-like [Toxorhynchites rutilus septentrionalis]|uniref:zinc finger protein 37-like n=1 Tax=Toxorhynchites rutilus septentrionalis TaxID=329112 RepID=UPI0024784AB4|nr:zinc finger protein 37-like [Toxorhynchites rutilus septentrionalis]
MEPERTMCRLCLKTSKPASMILLNDNENFVSAIRQIANVEVIVRPDHAVHMCHSCHSLLEQCVEFRQSCIDNDSIFRKMYSEANTEHVKPEESLPTDAVVKLEGKDKNISSDYNNVSTESEDINHTGSDNNNEESGKERLAEQKRRKRKCKTDNASDTQKTRYKSRKDARKVQCQYCGVMIVHYNLAKHQEIHNPDRPKFCCPQCPKFYTDTRKLKLHINATHTRDKLYACDRCGKVYGRPASLREHYIASHTDIKRYECKLCGQKFARAAMRTHHYKIMHTTNRPWACEYCDKTFKLKGDWTIHTRTHTGEKPFKCDICYKTFNKSYNVVIHKKSHRNDKKDSPNKSLEIS